MRNTQGAGQVFAIAPGYDVAEEPSFIPLAALSPVGSSDKAALSHRVGSTAVVPISGVLRRHMTYARARYGMGAPAYSEIAGEINALAEDYGVSRILLSIDSPGGDAVGMVEVAETIAAAAKRKPVTAFVNGNALSAAYAIASGASRIVSGVSSQVGSIGTYAVLADVSGMLEQFGVKLVTVSSGGVKGLGADGTVPDELIAEVQKRVLAYNDLFIETVAAGRGVPESTARRWADGQVYIAREALEIGLIDSIGTIEALLEDNGDFLMKNENRDDVTPRNDQPPPDTSALTDRIGKLEASTSKLVDLMTQQAEAAQAQLAAQQKEAEEARATYAKQAVEGLVSGGFVLPAQREGMTEALLKMSDEKATAFVRSFYSQGRVIGGGPASDLPSETVAATSPATPGRTPLQGREIPRPYTHAKGGITRLDPEAARVHEAIQAQIPEGVAPGSPEYFKAYREAAYRNVGGSANVNAF